MKKIFISWSGNQGKEIAKKLKILLTKDIFPQTQLECFVSDEDIRVGEEWLLKLRENLKSCNYGIICLTNQNIKEPWINLEFGALLMKNVKTVPMLFNCSINDLGKTPFRVKQCIEIKNKADNKDKFIELIVDINKKLKLLSSMEEDEIKNLAAINYTKFMHRIKSILKILQQTKKFNIDYIYPNTIKSVEKKSLYIATPMATISEKEYKELREFQINLIKNLKGLGFNSIYSPINLIESKEKFEGKEKAIRNNFEKLKETEYLLVIYPKEIPSSVLVEIGYGIALTKKMIIFYREKLPYMLEEVGNTMNHVKTYKFSEYEDICRKISSNGEVIFDRGGITYSE